MIGTDYIGSFKSNYHTITTTTAPHFDQNKYYDPLLADVPVLHERDSNSAKVIFSLYVIIILHTLEISVWKHLILFLMSYLSYH